MGSAAISDVFHLYFHTVGQGSLELACGHVYNLIRSCAKISTFRNSRTGNQAPTTGLLYEFLRLNDKPVSAKGCITNN